ncbi:RNA polymerase subunit sigma-70 [Nonomuraea jiangxiensis]|uniref:RNA polymerase sigma factor n=1 Tax=Nonomuraea jiangxiensis TaxID=633440 RepID=A0A1G9IUH5_9ACTN|nr:RNA polymerase subunit sigma-70 [Nonomuraea jiangxiensis]SDL28762.1 RNA polymerase sigma-70 factor, TIGR02960 family [Nonomuraea jiangxiensis]
MCHITLEEEIVVSPGAAAPTTGAAVVRFLDSVTAATTRAGYAETLARLTTVAGPRHPVAALTPEHYAAVMDRWQAAAAATWNRHLSALTSFTTWARRHDLLTTDPARRLERRRTARGDRSIPRPRLEPLFTDTTHALRERVLWRLLYDTAARAEEILALNVEDLDLEHRRAPVVAKGGAVEYVHWAAPAARLLPGLLAGRTSGPVFLADRRAPTSGPRVPAPADLCPITGRGRLSYPRAEFLFKAASARLDPHGRGWTLHQLRHSALRHLAQAGHTAPELRAKSRHQHLASLGRYVRRGDETPAAAEAAAGAQAVDEAAFGGLVEQYRRELQVHCYRMVGSFEESEDLVQETFLRAWRKRDSFQGRSTFRAWLYRIATNACLDFLDRHPRHPLPREDAQAVGTAPDEIRWLQPYPDRLLEPVAPGDAEPDAASVRKETIELAFLVAIQHLPARQRAVLILRDVLGWPAKETSLALGLSVAAVKSALQRARPTMKTYLPRRREEWAPSGPATAQERALLRRFMDAHERADTALFAELLREDVRMTMPPLPFWFSGREAVTGFAAHAFGPHSPLHRAHWRSVLTRANRQPAVAGYVRLPGEIEYRAQVLNVLRIEGGEIAEITAFEPRLFAAFDLPLTLSS